METGTEIEEGTSEFSDLEEVESGSCDSSWDNEEWHELCRYRKEYMHHLFEKYENNKEENDVIDLMTMKLVKDCGSIRNMEEQRLGCITAYIPLNICKKKNLASDNKYQETNEEEEWIDLSTDISSYSDSEDDSIDYQNNGLTTANRKNKTWLTVCEWFCEEETTSDDDDDDPFYELIDRALYVGNSHLYRNKQSASIQNKTTAADKINSEKNSCIKSDILDFEKLNICNSSNLSVENFGHSNDSKTSFLKHKISIDDISMCSDVNSINSSSENHPKISKIKSFSSYSLDAKREQKIEMLTYSKHKKFSIDHNQLHNSNTKTDETASCSFACIDDIKDRHISRVPVDDLGAIKSNKLNLSSRNNILQNSRRKSYPSRIEKEIGKEISPCLKYKPSKLHYKKFQSEKMNNFQTQTEFYPDTNTKNKFSKRKVTIDDVFW